MPPLVRHIVSLAASGAALVLSSCGAWHDTGGNQSLSTNHLEVADPVLNQRALAILGSRCASCHGPNSAGLGGFRTVLNPEAMFQAGIILPGSPDLSRLIGRVRDGSMAPGNPVPADDVRVLVEWIQNGLKLSTNATTGTTTNTTTTGVTTNVPIVPVSLEVKDAALNQQALALLQTKCASCHGPSGTGEGGFSDVLDAGKMVARGLLVPGDATGSKFFRRASDGTMPPPPGVTLTASEVQLLRDWINAGIALAPGITPPPNVTLTFAAGTSDLAKSALTILSDRCTSCHSASSGPTRGGRILNMLDPQQLQISGLVVPGNSTKSPLYQSVLNGRMPKAPSTLLTTAEIDTIGRWIDTDLRKDTPSLLGFTPTPLTATFASIQANILATRCVLCHGGSLGTKEGVSYLSYTSTLRTVSKGNPSRSRLYTECSSGSMPERTVRLSAGELSAIADWIASNVPNN